jgi:hypothetical protein
VGQSLKEYNDLVEAGYVGLLRLFNHVKHMTRYLLLCLFLSQAACESCDFSFGPIPVTVQATLQDSTGQPITDGRSVDVSLCTGEGEESSCEVGVILSGAPFETFVSWDGYLSCRRPALNATLSALGCTTQTVSLEETRHSEVKDVTLLQVSLVCEP